MLSDIFLTRFLTDVVHLNHPETSQRRFAPTPDHFTGISGPLHWNTHSHHLAALFVHLTIFQWTPCKRHTTLQQERIRHQEDHLYLQGFHRNRRHLISSTELVEPIKSVEALCAPFLHSRAAECALRLAAAGRFFGTARPRAKR
jgi:hypothetical protein